MRKMISCILCVGMIVSLAGCSGGGQLETTETIGEVETEKADIETILNTASYVMLNGAAKAEGAYNLLSSVWYDAIFKKSEVETLAYVKDSETGEFLDFNKAIDNLYMDEAFIEDIDTLKKCLEIAEKSFKDMKNVPEQYKDCYSTLTEMYKDFTSMLSMVISPDGSYQDFTDKFMEHDSEFMQNYNLVKTQLPDLVDSEEADTE